MLYLLHICGLTMVATYHSAGQAETVKDGAADGLRCRNRVSLHMADINTKCRADYIPNCTENNSAVSKRKDQMETPPETLSKQWTCLHASGNRATRRLKYIEIRKLSPSCKLELFAWHRQE